MNDSAPRLLARAGIEVLVVVVGILIAFGLDSWWDARQAAAWERTEITALRDEFAATVEHVERIVGSHERTAAQVGTIVNFALNRAPGTTAVFPDTVVTQLITWRTSEISSGTLDALLASDDLGRLSNPDLRRDLTAWKAWVLDAQEKPGARQARALLPDAGTGRSREGPGPSGGGAGQPPGDHRQPATGG